MFEREFADFIRVPFATFHSFELGDIDAVNMDICLGIRAAFPNVSLDRLLPFDPSNPFRIRLPTPEQMLVIDMSISAYRAWRKQEIEQRARSSVQK